MDSQLTRKQLADIQRTQQDVALLKRMKGNNGIFVQFLGGIPQISFNGATGTGTGNAIYVKITGRSGTKYSFAQYEPNTSGSPTLVDGGESGTTSEGYLQDIAGFADDGIINKYAIAIPSTTIPGTWIMGPWKKQVITTTVQGSISVASSCNPETGVITNTVTQGDPTVTTYTLYYIGG